MGNDESCCVEIDQKRGEIESKVNSLKYSSIIHNAQNSNRRSNFRAAKNVFSNHIAEPQENIFNPRNSLQAHSSKISNQQKNKLSKLNQPEDSKTIKFSKGKKSSLNQNHLSQASFQSQYEKFHNKNLQNPEKAQSIHSNELNQETIQYLKSSKASQQRNQLNNHFRADLVNQFQSQQNELKKTTVPKQKTQIRTAKSSVKQQLTIDYLPIVRKVIERQRPFETELQRVPKDKIKILRVNNGKDIYKGQLNYYEKPHGYGVLAKENGNILIGKFDNGSINGFAYYIFNNGSYYDGYMLDNKANDDQGEFHSRTMSYIGGFKDNLFHGQGKQISDNYYFEGLYHNHAKKSGTFMWNSKIPTTKNNPQKPSNSSKAQQDELQIPKVRRFQEPAEYDFLYQGSFDENQLFTGKGKLKDPNGEYKGDFHQGKKHGVGTYHFENNLRYVGEYKDNKKEGYGKLYNCDNSMAYEGNWKDNLPDGKGLSYGMYNKPVELEFIQGISTLLAPEAK